MLKQSSRKRLDTKTTGSFTDLLTRRNDTTSERDARRSVGCVAPAAGCGPVSAFFSAASFLAHDPATDSHVLQADSKHLFAAAITSKTTARGGHYLRQHIHMELLAQIKQHNGDIVKAIQVAVFQLNRTFRNLHPFNPEIFEGVQFSLAYVDFGAQKLHVASNGGCRVVAGRATSEGGIETAADVGRQEPDHVRRKDGLDADQILSLPLTNAVDTVIIGSSGFWQELPPAKGILRAHHFYESAPKASQGSAATHLINFALHCVTRRLRSSRDPRMRSLHSVHNLLSLHTGEKSQFKWGDRQPVRRRRGDVHGDMTAVVFRLDWEGKQGSFKEHSKKVRQALSVRAQQSAHRQYSHWDLVRLHFLEFPRQSRQHTEEQWSSLVSQALFHKSNFSEPTSAEQQEPVLVSVLDKEKGLKQVSMDVRAGGNSQPGTPMKSCA